MVRLLVLLESIIRNLLFDLLSGVTLTLFLEKLFDFERVVNIDKFYKSGDQDFLLMPSKINSLGYYFLLLQNIYVFFFGIINAINSKESLVSFGSKFHYY